MNEKILMTEAMMPELFANFLCLYLFILKTLSGKLKKKQDYIL